MENIDSVTKQILEENSAVDMAQRILNAIQKEFKNMTKLNVMILGKTGVGKSTLVNRMFGEKLVDTGIGKPVTTQIQKIEKPDVPLAIYDTPGLELSGENAFDSLLADVKEVIANSQRSGDISQMIHCIWYCVGVPSHRYEKADADFLKKVKEQLDPNTPIIIVLTQGYFNKDTSDLKKKVIEENQEVNLDVSAVIPILADDYYDYDEEDKKYVLIRKSYGLDKLSETMNDAVPEAVQKTFVAMQCVNLDLKVRKAHAAVVSAAATAVGIGVTPIPFADAVLLVPTEIGMLTGITAIFGLPVEKATLAALISSTIGATGATVLGKTIVANLLKFIPGAGSTAGGAISGATAAALTAALGEAYIAILSKVCKGDIRLSELQTEEGKKMITDAFKSRLKLKRKKDGTPLE